MTAPRVVVVGAGVSGLTAAHRLRQRIEPSQVWVVDRAPKVGGKISTLRRDGLVLEEGPDSFLTTKPEGLALCRELGIASRLVGTLPASPRGYVRRGGTLHPIPEGMSGLVPARLRGILGTRLLSLPGKLRFCAEPFVPALAADTDESVAGFIRRRFGAEAYEHLFEPLLGGIYAGNGNTLSLAATCPQLRTLERRYGSVLQGLRRERTTRPAAAPPPFVSFPTGMAELVEALIAAMPDVAIHRNTGIRALARREGRWVVHLEDGGSWECDGVILAIPAHEAAGLLRDVDGSLSGALGRIPHVSSTTVTLALPRREVAGRLPPGHGLLSPRTEGGAIVAWTFVDHKFPGRAPGEVALLRAFLGRSGAHVGQEAPADELIAVARADLRRTFGIGAEPIGSHVARWPLGLPQYTLDHRPNLAAIEARTAAIPGLALAGASYRGVGIPDCIASGWRAATAAMEGSAP